LAGFAAKFQIFSVLYQAGDTYATTDQPHLGYIMYALLVIGGINTVLSAVYYIKVLKVMALDPPPEQTNGQPVAPVTLSAGAALYGSLLAAMIVVVFLAWEPLGQASDRGVDRFREIPAPAPKAEAKP
jgi:NADH:ubiquinone oxidoreductase subunit 2 (subunit N)